MKFFNTPSKLVLLVCFIIAQWHIQYVRIPCDNWKTIIQSDVYGYYGYLPAIFIYRSFDYRIEQSPDNKDPVKKENPGGAIKYYVGEAFLLLPFFTIADMITQTIDLSSRNGYSFYYPLFISIAALFYLFLGLIFLRKLLLGLKFSELAISITLISIFFGTQLYYYSLHEPGMSHVYSFSMISTLLYLFHKQIHEPVKTRWLAIALVVSLIVFLRPVNVLFALAFIPLATSYDKAKEFILSFFKSGITTITLFTLIIGAFFFLQALMYYLQTGSWWVYSYGGESFNWTKSQIGNVLFSYRKGLFIYTPLLILAFLGLWHLQRKLSSFAVLSWLGIMFVFLYVTASWWYWAYGGSLGMRPFIDSYAFWAIPFAAICETSVKTKLTAAIFLTTTTAIIYVSLIQSYQYIVKILPYEHITQERYWHAFLKTSDKYRFAFPSDPDSVYYYKSSPPVLDTIFYFNQEIEVSLKNENKEGTKIEFVADKLNNLAGEGNRIQSIIIDFELWLSTLDTDSRIICALISDFSENAVFWRDRFLVTLSNKEKEWVTGKLKIQLPEDVNQELFCSIYLANDSKEIIKARNLRVRFYK